MTIAPVAVITGGSHGLGSVLAHALAEAGWTIVTDGRNAADLHAAVPSGHVAVVGDVTDPAHRTELVKAAASHGGASLLVNNASTLGASPLPRLADLDSDTFRRILAVNVEAPLALTRELLPQLRAHRGQVLNITSDASQEAYESWGGYGASKAALDQLSRVLGAEEPGLRVYAVDPGDLRTRMHQDAFPGEDISDRPLPETVVPTLLGLIASSLPSGRVRAADLANLNALLEVVR